MNVKNKRQLMWSEKLIDKNENVELIIHRPVKQNIALSCDEEWEGSCCGYPSMVKVGGEIRMYYRASTGYLALGNSEGRGIMCVAISHDGGKTFTKPCLGLNEYKGSKDNNIVYRGNGSLLDNFSVYYDENPDCPDDAKFKALVCHPLSHEKLTLEYFKSADGFSFQFSHNIDVYGAFDTLNTILWDDKKNVYRI